MNPEHLAPMATILEIEPSELSVLTDCDVSLDALNFLGKRMDGMCKAELRQFLAVLGCEEVEIGYGLKNIINLTDNLARFTLIEDTDNLERIGRIHMLNIHGALSESEYGVIGIKTICGILQKLYSYDFDFRINYGVCNQIDFISCMRSQQLRRFAAHFLSAFFPQ